MSNSIHNASTTSHVLCKVLGPSITMRSQYVFRINKSVQDCPSWERWSDHAWVYLSVYQLICQILFLPNSPAIWYSLVVAVRLYTQNCSIELFSNAPLYSRLCLSIEVSPSYAQYKIIGEYRQLCSQTLNGLLMLLIC